MAEQVQATLDAMVPPLRDLMDRGIFSQDEIRAIVARRRESEYLLRRRVARKADFLKYIEDEMALERLRQLRNRRLSNRKDRKELRNTGEDEEGKSKRRQQSRSQTKIGDHHIVQNIHLLFTRALRKFRSDVDLHLQHAAFAKQARSFNRLSRIYMEALQVHPRVIGLWIEAASHEFFGHTTETGNVIGGGEVKSARVLLQRGLRTNPKAQELWIQYFCMELHHIQRLRGRKEILMLEDGDRSDGSKEKQSALFADAPIPTVIYNNAIKAIPDDVSFRLKFLDVCRGFPQVDKIEMVINNSIVRDFTDKPEAWIARAMFAAEKGMQNEGATEDKVGFLPQGDDRSDGIDDEEQDAATSEGKPNKRRRHEFSDPVLNILWEAAETLPSAEMYSRVLQFLSDYEENPSVESQELSHRIIQWCTGEEECKVRSVELTLEIADYLEGTGSSVEEVKQCLQKHHESIQPRCDVPVLLRLLSRMEPAEALTMLKKTLAKLALTDRSYLPVSLEYFEALIVSNSAETAVLKDQFEKMLMLSTGDVYLKEIVDDGSRSVEAACDRYLEYTFERSGLKESRKVVDMVLKGSCLLQVASPRKFTEERLMHLTKFLDRAIQQELQSPQELSSRDRVKSIYAVAIRFFAEWNPVISRRFKVEFNRNFRFG